MAKTKTKPKTGQKSVSAKPALKQAVSPDAFTTKIIAEFKDRTRTEIKKWRAALDLANNPEDQRLYSLYDICDNLRSDGHYLGDVNLRKAATLCSPFSIVDRVTGEVNAEKTILLQTKWFYDFMSSALDYLFLGYTLLELVDPQQPKFKVIPRRNLIPVRQEILLSIQDSNGLDYVDRLGRTLIEIGEPEDLGLMPEICGLLIWKRNAQQSWAEHSERFGFPLITATTSKTSPADIANMRAMLSALGEGAQAVLPEGTTIDIKESGGKDAYLVYDKQIERINTEISKPIVGGTMITDDGSSRSQSEVHERNLDDKVAEDDRRMITFTVNDQLLPMLALWGHPFDPAIDRFQFDQSDVLTLDQFWLIVNGALNFYDIEPEFITKKFGIPIVGRRQQPLHLGGTLSNSPKKDEGEEPGTATALGEGGFSANFR